MAKAFSATRESEDEEEEMKYMAKGRDFCLDLCGIIDILSKPMEMMTKAQSLDQYLWSVTKWWPRVKAVLHAMKEDIEKHLVNDEVTIQKEHFPKLKLHYENLSKENAMECTFKNVELLPGWMVVKEAVEIDDATGKKRKVIEWVDRTPTDCLEEMASLCETIAETVETRYNKRVSRAAHFLGGCFHVPDILSLVQGSTGSGFTASQLAALDAYGREEFQAFFKYVFSLPHIVQLADDQPELSLLPTLSHRVHQLFKEVVVRVVWNNLGDCRKFWFPPLEGVHGQGILKEFRIKREQFEMEDKFLFNYDDSSCITRLDQAAVFSTFYTDEAIYNMAGREVCLALAMSGSEAVVESYYSVMKSQKMEGGQLNDTRGTNKC